MNYCHSYRQNELLDSASNAPIKLIYRGQTYKYTPPQAIADRKSANLEQPIELIYRGQTYFLRW
jgi:hypothetical protein